MTAIRRFLMGAVVLAASLGVGMAFTADAGQAAKACYQYQAHWETDAFGNTNQTCDGVCDGPGDGCCEPCAG